MAEGQSSGLEREQRPLAHERKAIALERLRADILGAELLGEGGLTIHGITASSRGVEPGDLFVAVRGSYADGNDFIPEALRHGARAIATERTDIAARCPVPCLIVPDARAALAVAASAFHGHPGRRLGLIGVTGTDGKTTTASMVHHLLTHSGRPAGLLSTVEIRIGGLAINNDTNLTTPEAPTVQAFLADVAGAGLLYAVLEVSSHALAMQRVAGCDFDVGVFTNLSPEHLDFHGDAARYLEAKAMLFAGLARRTDKAIPKAAVINADDCAAPQLSAVAGAPVITYGIDSLAEVRGCNIARRSSGTRFEIVTPQGKVVANTRLRGHFNVYNWLAAVAAALSLGVPLESIPAAIESMGPVRGRLQPVECGQQFQVLVDFAHTPNGLQQTLQALREDCGGRLLAVIGHPGGRDRRNRPQLGAVAAAFCDVFIIAGDDPYDEEPEPILAEIAQGARLAGAVEGWHFVRILDRREAIAAAFARAQPGDTVLLAGRGHLTHWVAKGHKEPFDDAMVARALLLERFPSVFGEHHSL